MGKDTGRGVLGAGYRVRGVGYRVRGRGELEAYIKAVDLLLGLLEVGAWGAREGVGARDGRSGVRGKG